jgi:methionine synthase I (cobalamin-dependent)
MGTRLVGLGLKLGDLDPALWNLTHPESVLQVHRRDVAAGADALVANTFGANRYWLGKFGRGAAVESINQQAVALARTAAGPRRFVLGDIGPTVARLAGAAREQAGILEEAGVDALYLETFRAAEIESVLGELAARPRARAPLFVSLWDWPAPPDALARRLVELGVSVIGMNCQPGIDAAVAFARRLSAIVKCPLLVKPASGAPGCSGGDPAAFAAAVPPLLEANVRLLGGCCGTDERHVAALSAALTNTEGPRRKQRGPAPT